MGANPGDFQKKCQKQMADYQRQIKIEQDPTYDLYSKEDCRERILYLQTKLAEQKEELVRTPKSDYTKSKIAKLKTDIAKVKLAMAKMK